MKTIFKASLSTDIKNYWNSEDKYFEVNQLLNYFIRLALVEARILSFVKLNYLLYFSYGLHLYLYEQPLYKNARFKVVSYSGVEKALWQQYHEYDYLQTSKTKGTYKIIDKYFGQENYKNISFRKLTILNFNWHKLSHLKSYQFSQILEKNSNYAWLKALNQGEKYLNDRQIYQEFQELCQLAKE